VATGHEVRLFKKAENAGHLPESTESMVRGILSGPSRCSGVT
jgi:hypothetical protein